jgi:hypothetical protein
LCTRFHDPTSESSVEDEVTALLERERGCDTLDALTGSPEQDTDQADAYRIADVEDPALDLEEDATTGVVRAPSRSWTFSCQRFRLLRARAPAAGCTSVA